MTPSREPEHEPVPGIPFLKRVCACSECGRLVTAESSVERGCGPTCYAKARRALLMRHDPRQLAMPWAESEART